MALKSVEAIFGVGSLVLGGNIKDDEVIAKMFDIAAKNGTIHLDVSKALNGSEALISRFRAGERFGVNSKTPGGLQPGTSTGINIVQHARESCEKSGVRSVSTASAWEEPFKADCTSRQLDVYVIHAPDPTLDLEDMLHGLNEAYQAGYFRRLGLSNFAVEQVKQAHSICSTHGWIVPTVYEGNYNPVGRKMEDELLPVLRQLGISFYAYSPLAGGFLTKTATQVTGGGADAGRWTSGTHFAEMYAHMYNKPSLIAALELWAAAAEAAACSPAELAYRWVAFDSALSGNHGDALIFGASKFSQIEQIYEWLGKGSVGEDVKKKIDAIWKTVEDEAIVDNYHNWIKDKQLGGAFAEQK